MTDIVERVKKAVARELRIDEANVVAEASFVDDLGADSLDTVAVVMALEEEFGIEISDDDCENILTVGEAVKYVEKALR